MASDRPEGSNPEQSIAKRMGNRLRRMFGLENLHDGSREQFEEAHESIPEGGNPRLAETASRSGHSASAVPDADLSRSWSTEFESFPTPGSGAGQSRGNRANNDEGGTGSDSTRSGFVGSEATSAPPRGNGVGLTSASNGGGGGGGSHHHTAEPTPPKQDITGETTGGGTPDPGITGGTTGGKTPDPGITGGTTGGGTPDPGITGGTTGGGTPDPGITGGTTGGGTPDPGITGGTTGGGTPDPGITGGTTGGGTPDPGITGGTTGGGTPDPGITGGTTGGGTPDPGITGGTTGGGTPDPGITGGTTGGGTPDPGITGGTTGGGTPDPGITGGTTGGGTPDPGVTGGTTGGGTPDPGVTGGNSTPDGQPTLLIIGQPQSLVVDESDLKADVVRDFGKFFQVNYGPDGQGNGGINFNLGIPKQGIDCGLVDTESQEHILLFQEADGSVIGRTAGGLEAFKVTVSPQGHLGLDQLRAMVHPNPQNIDESETLAGTFMVTLTGTAIDANGSQASVSLAIGQMLQFKDDGPTVELKGSEHPPIIKVDESFIGKPNSSSTHSFESAFKADHSYGADGTGTFHSEYKLEISKEGAWTGLIDSQTGEKIVLHLDHKTGVVTGLLESGRTEALRVEVNQTGDVTFTTERAVIHPRSPQTNEDVHLIKDTLSLTRTDSINDKDHDHSQATLSVDLGSHLAIKDSTPTINNPTVVDQPITIKVVEHSAGAGSQTASIAALFNHDPGSATDQHAVIDSHYNLNTTNGTDSGLVDNNNHQIFLYKDGSGNLFGVALTPTQALNPSAFTPNPATTHALDLTINPDTGIVTFQSNTAIAHGKGSSGQGDSLSLATGSVLVECKDTITDADGDSRTGTATADLSSHLSITDTDPTINNPTVVDQPITIKVVEHSAGAGSQTASIAALFNHDPGSATDQHAVIDSHYNLNTANGTDSGLVDNNNHQIFLYKDGSGNLFGVALTPTQALNPSAFTPNPATTHALDLTINPDTGIVTFQSNTAIAHGKGSSGQGDSLSLATGSVLVECKDTITDADGDSRTGTATADLSSHLSITDTDPTINNPTVVDQPITIKVVEHSAGAGSQTASIAALFNHDPGSATDQHAVIDSHYNLNTTNGTDSGLVDNNNHQIFLYKDGSGNLFGVALTPTQALNPSAFTPNPATTHALDLTINPDTGIVTFQSNTAIAHGKGSSGQGDSLSLATGSVLVECKDTITDADGDSRTGTATADLSSHLSITDTDPTINNPTVVDQPITIKVVEHSAGAGSQTASIAALFNHDPGSATDQHAVIDSHYNLNTANGTDSGLVDNNNHQIFLYKDGSGNLFGVALTPTQALNPSAFTPNPATTHALDLTINPDTGIVTFQSNTAIAHGKGSSGQGDSLSLATGSVLVECKDTITDADGDSRTGTATADLSSHLSITDTDPTINNPTVVDQPITIKVVEHSAGAGSQTASIAALFNHDPGSATDQHAVIDSHYNLNTTNGTDSGLVDNNNHQIFLYKDGSGNLFGVALTPTQALNPSAFTPNPATTHALDLTINPDTGIVTFQSNTAIAHGKGSSGQGDSLSLATGSVLVECKDTITDADGDSRTGTATADLSSHLSITDTDPTINNPTVVDQPITIKVVEHSAGAGSQTASIAALFNHDPGSATDQHAVIDSHYNLNTANGTDSGLVDNNNHQIFLYKDGSGNLFGVALTPTQALNPSAFTPNPATTHALDLTINPDTGIVTFQSNTAIAHGKGSSGQGDSLSLATGSVLVECKDTITDADGDSRTGTATADLSSHLSITDTDPTINNPTVVDQPITIKVVEHSAGAGSQTASIAALFNHDPGSATDQHAVIDSHYNLNTANGTDSGLVDNNNHQIFLYKDGSGNLFGVALTPTQALNPSAFTPNPATTHALDLTINPDTGIVTFQSNTAIAHGKGSSGQGDSLSLATGSVLVECKDTITDADGDSRTGTATADLSSHLSITDTDPTINNPTVVDQPITIKVVEHSAGAGSQTASIAALFNHDPGSATDQHAVIDSHYNLNTTNGTDSGLVDNNNHQIFLYKDGSGNLFGVALTPTQALNPSAFTPNPATTHALDLTINPDTGIVTFQSNTAIAHGKGSSGQGDSLSLATGSVLVECKDTITDADGDSRTGTATADLSSHLSITDTDPTINNPTVVDQPITIKVVEHSAGAGSQTASIAALFNHDPGSATDQHAVIDSHYNLNTTNGTDSGLVDNNNHQIFLYKDGSGNLFGVALTPTQALNPSAFTPNPATTHALDLTINPDTGIVTFQSNTAIAHGKGSSGQGDSLSLATGSVLVECKDTITDADGDSRTGTATADLSSHLSITDTDPTINNPTVVDQPITIKVVEHSAGAGSQTASIAALFNHDPGSATDQHAVIDSHYNLNTTNGTDSGLVDNNNHKIFLYKDGSGNLFGVSLTPTQALNPSAFTPNPATTHALDLTINPDTGIVTFQSNTAIAHGKGSSGQGDSLSLATGSVLVECKDTITDADGDSRTGTATADLSSHLSITDTDPTINNPTVVDQPITIKVVEHSAGAGSQTASIAALFNHDPGSATDQHAVIDSHYNLNTTNGTDSGLVDNNNHQIFLYKDGSGNLFGVALTPTQALNPSAFTPNPATTHALDLTINPDTGIVTFQSNTAIAHGKGSSGQGDSLSLATGSVLVECKDTITDADGDSRTGTATADLSSHLSITDTDPTINNPTVVDQPITIKVVEHSAGAGSQTASIAALFNHDPGSATDQHAVIDSHYNLNTTNGTDSGLVDNNNHKIFLYKDGSGNLFGVALTPTQALNPSAFTPNPATTHALDLTINPDTGIVTFQSNTAIAHGKGSSGQGDSLSLATGSVLVECKDTITDADGDSRTGTATADLSSHLSITDTDPTINNPTVVDQPITIKVVEHSAGAGSQTASIAALFNHDPGSATDQHAVIDSHYNLNTTNGTDSGLVDNNNHKIFLYKDGSGNLFGVALTPTQALNPSAFTPNPATTHALDLTINPDTGIVTFQSNTAIAHGKGSSGQGDSLSLATGSVLVECKDTITDADGDSRTGTATADLSSHLSITDDGPSITANQKSIDWISNTIAQSGNIDSTIGRGDPTALLDFTQAFTSGMSFSAQAGADQEKVGTRQLGYSLEVFGGGQAPHSPLNTKTIGGFTLTTTQEANGDIVISSYVTKAPSIEGPTIRAHLNAAHQVEINLSGGNQQINHLPARNHFLSSIHDQGGINHLDDLLPNGMHLRIVGEETITDRDLDQASARGYVNFGEIVNLNTTSPSTIDVDQNALSNLTAVVDESYLTSGADKNPAGDNDGSSAKVDHIDIDQLFKFSSGQGVITNQGFDLNATTPRPSTGGLVNDNGDPLILIQTANGYDLVNSKSHADVYAHIIKRGSGNNTELSFELTQAVKQADNQSNDEKVNLQAYGLTITAHGQASDGTPLQAIATIGDKLGIEDDGPTIQVTASTKSVSNIGTSQDGSGIGSSGIHQQDLSTLFISTENFGADGRASVNAISTSYSLSIQSNGVNSGLTCTENMAPNGGNTSPIYLYSIGGKIYGSTQTSAPSNPDQDACFVISTDNQGNVQFDQRNNFISATGTNIHLGDPKSFDLGLVSLTKTETVIDHDADSATDSATVDIGTKLQILNGWPKPPVTNNFLPSPSTKQVLQYVHTQLHLTGHNLKNWMGHHGYKFNSSDNSWGLKSGHHAPSNLIPDPQHPAAASHQNIGVAVQSDAPDAAVFSTQSVQAMHDLADQAVQTFTAEVTLGQYDQSDLNDAIISDSPSDSLQRDSDLGDPNQSANTLDEVTPAEDTKADDTIAEVSPRDLAPLERPAANNLPDDSEQVARNDNSQSLDEAATVNPGEVDAPEALTNQTQDQDALEEIQNTHTKGAILPTDQPTDEPSDNQSQSNLGLDLAQAIKDIASMPPEQGSMSTNGSGTSSNALRADDIPVVNDQIPGLDSSNSTEEKSQEEAVLPSEDEGHDNSLSTTSLDNEPDFLQTLDQ